MAIEHVRTFCRICEPECGLVADVADGQLINVRPDREHPISRGYACHKGISALDLHRDPDRLSTPLRRTADGSWDVADWDTAVDDIARRLRAIIDAHGPQAVASYRGNPSGFNATCAMAFAALFGELGVTRSFSSATQDCANKFAAAEAVYGTRLAHPVPDLDQCEFLLLIGANPRASQGSFISRPNFLQHVRDAVRRGARVRWINPRRVETPDEGTGETILIRPDTDVYFLAALLCELDRLGAWRADVLSAHGAHVDELRAFVHRYPAERVASVTGIETQTVGRLVLELAGANGAAIYASTGVNMGRQGTLAYWLVQMVSLVTGNLDRAGGNIPSVGFYRNARSGRTNFDATFIEREFGSMRHGVLPGNLLSHYVLDADEPVRALIVIAGNPLLSIAGEERLSKALDQLELLVVIDLYANATAAHAHWVLPSTDMFERPDINVNALSLQSEPYVQYTEACVAPKGDRKEEWWIAARLAQALGVDSPLDEGRDGATEHWRKYDYMLSHSALSLDELKTMPGGIAVLPPLHTGRFFSEIIQTPDQRVDCCPAAFAPALERCERLFDEESQRGELKLITLRDAWMHNSYLHNLPRMHKHGHNTPRLHINPADAAARGLATGDRAEVSTAYGAVQLEVEVDAQLVEGAVAASHGWGHDRAPGMRHAAATGGANVNRLLPIGPDSFEPLSSQSFMTGVPVRVRKA